MKKMALKLPLYLIIFFSLSMASYASVQPFGSKLCKLTGYQCKTITRHDSWTSLFPNDDERELVKRINRVNGFLEQGMVIAVPDQLVLKSSFDFSPFPFQLKRTHGELMVIDQAQLAWGAYSDLGQLLYWGPISAGSSKCFGSKSGCETPSGTFYIYRKGGKDCYSRSYPKRLSGEHGGGYMPYCMFFNKGYAIHGSTALPGYNASHGCIRLIQKDAEWLNTYFVKLPKNGSKGTKVIILPKTKTFSEKLID